MSQKGHFLAFLCWKIQRVDLALVLEVEVWIERGSTAPSFQILLPNFIWPGGCLISFPTTARCGPCTELLEGAHLFPGGPGNSPTMDLSVSDWPGLVT